MTRVASGEVIWVVKLGGSLQDTEYLGAWLGGIAEYGKGRVVIVPGGGPFVDQVRNAQKRHRFDDGTAHSMALLGMRQYGIMLRGIQPALKAAFSIRQVRRRLHDREIPIWMPAQSTGGWKQLPRNWSVTSDSLALCLAQEFSPPRLALVKARSPPDSSTGNPREHPGLVDRDFSSLRRRLEQAHKQATTPTRVVWLGANQPRLLQELLTGRSAVGTELLSEELRD